ncbi:hypothetical protein [Flavivirga rizhaonensis]|uniref:hypothetical protein n=1 Tax=Flavivirga rizhaonensis TaxID=2559571 RepID=UPI001B8786DC|nr:hypothetical protein [Flavivirga rizhaonensis]
MTLQVRAQNNNFHIKYENPTSQLGLGLLILDYYNLPIIEIYNDKNLIDKFIDWDSNKPDVDIYPKFYELDYGHCDFVLLESTKTYHKILVGLNKVKYVKNSKHWNFISWTELITNSFGVTRKRNSRESNKLRISKSDNSKEIPIELKTHENFCVNQLKDNWVNVKYDCIYATDQYIDYEGEPCSNYIDKCPDNKTGWIMWKKDGELLIQIYLRP